jgi:hypothetical protein
MIPENFKTLVLKLKDKTSKKEAVWYKTSRDEEFKLDLVKGAITIDNWQDPESEEMCIDLVVINEKGDRIDSIFFTESEKEDYKFLFELHSIVKRAYYKVDETFKIIFEELDSDKTIGNAKKSDDVFF